MSRLPRFRVRGAMLSRRAAESWNAHPETRIPDRVPRAPGGHGMNRLFVCVAVLSLAGCETVPRWFPCSAHSSDDVLQALAYSGPVLPLAQVATIYAFD